MNNNANYYTLLNESSVPTYWQPNATVNTQIQQNSNIKSNWNYRQYIQQNANQIMKYNTMEYINSSGNNPYVVENKTSSANVPYVYRSTHDNSKPNYGYNNSDLKQTYIKPSVVEDWVTNLEKSWRQI